MADTIARQHDETQPDRLDRVNTVVSADLHTRIKVCAVRSRKQIREVLDEAISEWLDRHEHEASVAGGGR